MQLRRSNIIEIQYEIKHFRTMQEQMDENTGNYVGLYANDTDLCFVVVSSIGLVHEIGSTHDLTEAKDAYLEIYEKVFSPRA